MDDNVAAFVMRYEAMGLQGTPASPDEVAALEQQLGVTFPMAYKAFLFILGRDGGSDFIGSDCTIRHLPKLRGWAEELLRRCGSQYTLSEKAFVYLMHQGYSFFYFVADQTSQDPAVYAYLEGNPAPVKNADSFTAWLTL
jgi:SMI1-KNR4 cell-wall